MQKIIIIGSGPAGFNAALRLAHNGIEVTLVEKDRIGGVCLNKGCVPARSLFALSDLTAQSEKFTPNPVSGGTRQMMWKKQRMHSDEAVAESLNGMHNKLRHPNITVLSGSGHFVNENTVEVRLADAVHTISADAILLSTGASPVIPAAAGILSERIIPAEDFLSVDRIPASVTIIGGGVIGIELASSLSVYRTGVTIIEKKPDILDILEEEIRTAVKAALQKRGITILCPDEMKKVKDFGSHASVHCVSGKKIVSDTVIIAAGRTANSATDCMKALGIETKNGNVQVNEALRTNIPSVYAAGDVVNTRKFSSAAHLQGAQFADLICGKRTTVDSERLVPYTLFSQPPVAAVGRTSYELRNMNVTYRERIYHTDKHVMSRIRRQENGLIKVLADINGRSILGAQAVGWWAPQIIETVALAMYYDLPPQALSNLPHAFPGFADITGKALRF